MGRGPSSGSGGMALRRFGPGRLDSLELHTGSDQVLAPQAGPVRMRTHSHRGLQQACVQLGHLLALLRCVAGRRRKRVVAPVPVVRILYDTHWLYRAGQLACQSLVFGSDPVELDLGIAQVRREVVRRHPDSVLLFESASRDDTLNPASNLLRVAEVLEESQPANV